MRLHAIQECSNEYKTDLMCDLLDVNPSSYYAWVKRPQSARAETRSKIQKLVAESHQNSHKNYGYRKVHRDLVDQGVKVSPETVRRTMQAKGLVSRAQTKRKRRGTSLTDSNHQLPVAPNTLNREFYADRPNQKWLMDITELVMANGKKLYLAGVLDLFARRVVGWATSLTMDKDLVIQAFKNAETQRLKKGEKVELLCHSDRGSQYASWDYGNVLKFKQVEQSMSRKGNCWDNSPMEKVLGTIKNEWTYHESMRDQAEANQQLAYYIDVFYNKRRIHQALGYKTPDGLEQRYYDRIKEQNVKNGK